MDADAARAARPAGAARRSRPGVRAAELRLTVRDRGMAVLTVAFL